MKMRFSCCLWRVMVCSLVLKSTAHSASVWTGAIDGDWGNALNWDDGNVPGSNIPRREPV